MILATHIPLLLLSFLQISTAFSQPSSPLVRDIPPHEDINTLTLPTGWRVTTLRPSNYFIPKETACMQLDILYTHVIAVAAQQQSALTTAVAFRYGSFQLVFHSEGTMLSWIMVEHFCERMLEDVRRGLPVDYDAVLTQDYFESWVVRVTLHFVAQE